MHHPISHLSLILFVIGVSPIFSGCATTPQGNKVPFTHQLRERYSLSDDDLKQLQYYTSGTITLHREAACGQTKVMDGRLYTKSCSVIDDVLLKSGTPGVAIDVGENRLGISFEQGSMIDFGSAQSSRKEWNGKYGLVAEKWTNEVGELRFDEKAYRAIKDSWGVYLIIDEESLHKATKKKHTIKGVELD